jgi:hypothetical protein
MPPPGMGVIQHTHYIGCDGAGGTSTLYARIEESTSQAVRSRLLT